MAITTSNSTSVNACFVLRITAPLGRGFYPANCTTYLAAVDTSNGKKNGPSAFISIYRSLAVFHSGGINSFGGATLSPGGPLLAPWPPVPGAGALMATRYFPATRPPSRGTEYFPPLMTDPPEVAWPSVG